MRGACLAILLAMASSALPVLAQPPVVERHEPTVGPAYPAALVRRVVRRHLEDLARCGSHANDAARSVTFTIGADGHVTEATVERHGSGADPAADCVERVLRSMVFPAPPGGASMIVRYPLAELAPAR